MDKYEVILVQDNIYAVVLKWDWSNYLVRGSLVDINAWLSLRDKGYI